AGLPIYASEAFLRSESNEVGWLGGTSGGEDLDCVLPYIIVRKAGFHMVRLRTATIPLSDELSVEAEGDFLNGAVEHFRLIGADLILPSPNTAVFQTYPAGASAAPYGTVIKDLRQPERVLWSEIRKSYRQNIRKAQAEGVTIERGAQYLEIAYELIAGTMKRSGARFRSRSEFRRRVLALGENVELFVVRHNGVIQGCMVAPYSQHTAYNCYAGSLPAPALGAMHLLHWEAIRYFRALGVRFFDFQGIRINPEKGSKQDGIALYKRGFGGNLVQGYVWKYPLRPLKFAAYSLAARVLMGGDTVDQERHRLALRVS
ncbi:MAG: lipid II:glycine glycyltransferase FemX, partial [Terriglobia bacterium]